MRAANLAARRRLDARLTRIKEVTPDPPPHRGWIRAIRQALGMSTTELAARMGVTQSRVSVIEQGETRGTIKLETLRRAASALDCELVYALVPRTSLSEAVRSQARRKAAGHLRNVQHHMRLEDQAVTGTGEDELEDVARELIDRRGLWTTTATE